MLHTKFRRIFRRVDVQVRDVSKRVVRQEFVALIRLLRIESLRIPCLLPAVLGRSRASCDVIRFVGSNQQIVEPTEGALLFAMGYQGYCPRVKLFCLIGARSQGNRRSPGVHTRCLHSVPSGREYDLELREIRLEGRTPWRFSHGRTITGKSGACNRRRLRNRAGDVSAIGERRREDHDR